MNKMIYVGAFALLAALAACNGNSGQGDPGVSFNSGLRPNAQTPTSCTPANSTCGSGLGNPSVQSPVQKHEQNVSPE